MDAQLGKQRVLDRSKLSAIEPLLVTVLQDGKPITKADVKDGDLCELRGSLKSQSCVIDSAWLDEISRSKMLYANRSDLRWVALGAKVPASQLGLRFELKPNGL